MNKMDKVRILFFGVLSEETGKSEEEIPFSGKMSDLLDLLKQKYPSLSKHQFSIAVNQDISSQSIELRGGDEIALLPPFTGG